jgi:hypothetical protein
MLVRIEPNRSLIIAPRLPAMAARRAQRRANAKAVDLWTMRFAHRPACRGQRGYTLPTAPTFAHKLHSLPPPSMEDLEFK